MKKIKYLVIAVLLIISCSKNLQNQLNNFGGITMKANEKYKELNLSTLNLSRTMEDFCTGTAGFIPWAASGIYYPSVLGVSIAHYFPYCFMSYIIWILAYVYAATGICMKPLEKEED